MHIVYETTNLINGKKYIGVHKIIKQVDNYLGSGILLRKAIDKYGKEKFIRKTLIIVETSKEAFEYEKKLVTSDIVDNDMYYNLRCGGCGGNLPGKDHPWYGRRHTLETIEKMRIASSGKSKSIAHRRKISEHQSGASNNGARAVICIETGKEFSTILEASKSVGLKYPTSIRRVCTGQYKVSAGYHWRYKDNLC